MRKSCKSSRCVQAEEDLSIKNVMLVVEYDGTRFSGFQKQKNGRTVQEEIELALATILRKKVFVIPAGRTDSGVHARGQVVNFKTDTKIPLAKLMKALNTYLPADIAVKSVREVPPDFHARYSAKRKIYSYRIWLDEAMSPLERFYVTHYPHRLNVRRIKEASKLLAGRHDFRCFQARARDGRTSVRTLYRIEVKKKGSYLVFTFEGDGFLYNMVRNIVGTLLWVGWGKTTLPAFRKILAAKDRRLAGPTAPPQGLVLEKVIYE